MNSSTRYVPVLKGRDGEYGALQTLSESVWGVLTPVLELPPIPWDFEADRPARSIDTHLKKVGQKIERAWGTDRDIFVDLIWISETEKMADNQHPLDFVFSALRSRSVRAVPVAGLIRGDEYLSACRAIIAQDRRGACLRIQREDFADFPDTRSRIEEVMRAINVSVGDVDLLLDLRSLTQRSIEAVGVFELIQSIPRLNDWRSLITAATSFPQNLIGIPPSDSTYIDRKEWQLWIDTTSLIHATGRIPTFGDYAISHPEPAEVDPRIMRPSASVRYTCDSAWLVLKARNLRDHGYEQFHEVCRELIHKPDYAGPEFSWGDRYIADCAAERVGTGNLTTWRKVGTSHHLATVVNEISHHYGS
jgi:Beta protein